MTKVIVPLSVLAIIALFGAAVYRIRSLPAVRAQQSTVVPYTLYMVSELTDSAGKLTTLRSIVAKRSDGAIAQKNLSDTKDGVDAGVTVADPTTKLNIFYETSVKMKCTTAFSSRKAEAMRAGTKSATCADLLPLNPTFSTWDEVVGTKTAVYKREDASAKWAYYLAPEMDCTLLKQTQDWKLPDGTAGGTTRTEAVTLARGEPDSYLFKVPGDFIEVHPSILDAALWNHSHPQAPLPSFIATQAYRRDSGYEKSRQAALAVGVNLPTPVR